MFLLLSYFDHGEFMHHALHVLDDPASWMPNTQV